MGKIKIFQKWGQSLKQLKDKYFGDVEDAVDCRYPLPTRGKVNANLSDEELIRSPELKQSILNTGKQFTGPKHQTKFIGRKRIPRGQRLYEMNIRTFEVKQVELSRPDVSFNPDGTTYINKSLILKPETMYDHALNDRNARRRFLRTMKKMLSEAKVA